MDIWRLVLEGGQKFGDATLCDIPSKVRPIVDNYCQGMLGRTCPKIPCGLVRMSSKTNEKVRCHSNGQILNDLSSNATDIIECWKSPALDLFLNRSSSYPSIRSNGYLRRIEKLFREILSPHFRSSNSIWGLSFNWESIGNYPIAGDRSFLSVFNITEGYDRHLYHVITDSYLFYDVQNLLKNQRISYDSALHSKYHHRPDYINASVLYMNSNCYARSNRTEYMKEFMSYISVDSWGRCGNNRGSILPKRILDIQGTHVNQSFYQGRWTSAKKSLASNYLFTVAFENTLQYDYITEKLWQPLAAGSVPLYYGAPNIEEWLPCRNCIIDLRQFSSAKLAAEFVKNVANNATKYAEYHQWRHEKVPERFEKIVNYFNRSKLYSLDSMICAMAHSESPQKMHEKILKTIGPIFT